MDNTLLYSKLTSLPDNLKLEVELFIETLLKKNKKKATAKPSFGSAKGLFTIKNNFDAPLDDFRDYQ
jgi:hypothetical protein